VSFALLPFLLVIAHRLRDRPSAGERLRAILANEFSRRRGANPRYSLRAFARSIGIEHSTLSQLLRSKRAITWKSMGYIATRMRWTGASVLQAYKRRGVWDSRYIADDLGISINEVNVALSDLCLLGLMEMRGD